MIKAFDPVASKRLRRFSVVDSLTFAATLPKAIEDAEAVVLLTRWPEFQELPSLFSALSKQPVLIDGRRMLEKVQRVHDTKELD